MLGAIDVANSTLGGHCVIMHMQVLASKIIKLTVAAGCLAQVLIDLAGRN